MSERCGVHGWAHAHSPCPKCETKHSPEPWHAVETVGGSFYVTDSEDNHHIVKCHQSYSEQGANARRIVACVNACAGIPTEALESGALGKALDLLERGIDRIGLDCAVCHGGSRWSEYDNGTAIGGITHEDGCELAAALRSLGRLK